MIHQSIIQLLTQIYNSNRILYYIFIFIISYILLGFSAGILFIIAINLKEVCILTQSSKLKEKVKGILAVIFFWPYALPAIYDLWFNFGVYISCVFAGTTFRRNIMNDKNLVQIRHLVNNTKGEVSFKKLATKSMGCVEELVTEEERKGDTYVSIYGLEEDNDKPISQIVPKGVTFCNTTTLDFLRELKNNGLVGLRRVEPEKEIRFDFNDDKIDNFSLVFPEEVFCYIFNKINTVYVTKAMELDTESEGIDNPSLMEFKDQLYNEIHINDNSILFMIDYTQKESYAMDHNMNEIMNCEFSGNDPENSFTRVKIGDTILKYTYNPIGYLEKIDIESSNEDNEYTYYLKIVESDEKNHKRESITVTYVVPFLKDTGNVYVYSEDCRIYRTDNIYLERNKIIEWETFYRVLTDKEESDLNDAFIKTVENSSYILI